MKKLITILLVLSLALPCLPAFAVNIPLLHLSFDNETIENEALYAVDLSYSNVSYVDGASGYGVSIGTSGYIRGAAGNIGAMLDGASGITFSSYIKNGTKTDGNLFTIRYNAKKTGLKLEKEGSAITVSASSDSGESLLSATYDTGESFDDWVNVTVSINFATKRVKFFVNGVYKHYTTLAFTNDVFNFYSGTAVDTIGVAGLMLDEVKIFRNAVDEFEPAAWLDIDKGVVEQVAYKDILEDNLIARFPFNEGEGNTVYSEGPVRITGTSQTDLDWVPGIDGTAVQFHAYERNCINIGDAISRSLNGKSGMTVTAWVYINDESGSGYDNCIMTLSGSVGAPLLRYSVYGSGLAFAEVRSNPSNITGLSFYEAGKMPMGQWVHLTLSADLAANTLKYYINSSLVAEYHYENFVNTAYNETAALNFTDTKFTVNHSKDTDTIGGDPSLSGYTHTFNGAIDELRVYNRAMTGDEVNYIYLENKNGDWISKSVANYVKLNGLSQNFVVMAEGHNEIITQKERKRIDWDDISSTPVMQGGELMLPAKLATEIFGVETSTPISAEQVAQQIGKTYYCNEDGLAVIGTASAVSRVSDDSEFADWLYKELTVLPYPQQTADHYGTRQVVKYEANTSLWHSSPSVLELSDGTMLATHDTAGRGTTFYRSTDDGNTWTQVHYDEYVVYGSLFENNGAVYLGGVRRGTGEPAVPALYKSTDGGLTWTSPSDRKTGWLLKTDGTSVITPAHSAPTPVLKHNGRIYRAYETSGGNWKSFNVCIISADQNADLLDSDSWTISNFINLANYTSKFPEEILYSDPGMCEAMPVVGRDGNIYLLGRFNSAPSVDYAAVLKLTGNTLSFDRIIKFPGGMTKFYIQYDSKTDKYIALANPNIDGDYVLQRYCLSLLVSDDLFNWEVKETLQIPNWLENFEVGTTKYAFQYPSFYIDGDNLVYAVREANVGAHSYHNGNYITIYTLENYADYLD